MPTAANVRSPPLVSIDMNGSLRTLAEFHCAARSFPEADIGKGVQHSDDRTAAVRDKPAVRKCKFNDWFGKKLLNRCVRMFQRCYAIV